MGVIGFSKVFVSQKKISASHLKGLRVAIDAMTLIHKGSLGVSSTHTLTNQRGEPTAYLNTCLANILSFMRAGAEQIWCFDHGCADDSKTPHNPMKAGELETRHQRKILAKADAEILRAKIKQSDDPHPLISDDDGDSQTSELKKQLNAKEKMSFSVTTSMINNVKTMLDLLKVKWIEAPAGYEGESLAAALTYPENNVADAVFSADSDSIFFGATKFIRDTPRNKEWSFYDLNVLLEESGLTLEEFRRITVVLGCDFYNEKKMPVESRLFYRVGPKTVIKFVKQESNLAKFQRPEIVKTLEHYAKKCPVDKELIHNSECTPFEREDITHFTDWICTEHNFNIDRMKKRFA